MDLMEKALIRKQIEEMVLLQAELKQDLKTVQQELDKVEKLLNKKSYAKNKQLLEHKNIYATNKKEIEETIKITKDTINQLRLQSKPRATMQITRKLV